MYWIQTFIQVDGEEGPSEITQLSVTTPGIAWALDGSNQIWMTEYEFDSKSSEWNKPAQLPSEKKAIRIDSAGDGTVICLDSDHEVYRYNPYNNSWILMKNALLKEISTGGNCYTYGLSLENKFIYYIGECCYEQFGEGAFLNLSVGRDDTVFCIGMGHNLYRMLDGGGAKNYLQVPSKYKFKAVAVDSASQVMALTTDNKIVTYVGEGQFHVDSNKYYDYDISKERWDEKTIPGNYLSMSMDKKGYCYLVTHDSIDNKYRVFRKVEGDKPSNNCN